MKRIDYTKLLVKVKRYGVAAFYRNTGIGGSQMFTYKLEHGGDISLQCLDKCCEFFNCDISDLIELRVVNQYWGMDRI